MRKNILPFALSSCFLLGILSSCNQGGEGGGAQKHTFVDETGVSYEQYGQEWHITDYRGSADSIIIPATKTDEGLTLPVTAIEANAFYGRSQLKAIELPESLVSIGDEAFVGTSLDTFYATPYLGSVSKSAFKDTPLSIKSEGGVSFLPSKTNPHCIAYKTTTLLTAYAYPNDIERVYKDIFEDVMFSNSPDLSKLVYADEGAFRNTNIEGEVDLSSCLYIGASSFYHTGITHVTFASKMKEIGDRAFASCPIEGDVTLPAGMERLGNYCFEGVDQIKRLTLPFAGNSPTEPNDMNRLFGNYSLNLDSLTILGGEIVREFAGVSELTTAKLTLKDVSKVGYRAFNSHGSLSSLELQNVKAIGEWAFRNCGFSEVYVPDTTDTIEYQAFYSENPLVISFGKNGATSGYNSDTNTYGPKTEVRYGIPDPHGSGGGGSETQYGDWMGIEGSDGLILTKYNGNSNSPVVPKTIENKTVGRISQNAFQGRSDILSITLPIDLYPSGDGLLAPCTSLSSLTVWGQLSGNDLFNGNVPSTLKKLTILGDVVQMNGYDKFSSVEELVFSSASGVQIYDEAFKCPKVEDVYIPARSFVYANGLRVSPTATIRVHNSNNVSNWGRYLMNPYKTNWTNATNIVMVEDSTPIPTDSQGIQFNIESNGKATVVGFSGSATAITIPSTFNGAPVTKIAAKAFQKNGANLKSIIVPDSVIYMAFHAFQGCSSLEKISLPFVGSKPDLPYDRYKQDACFGILFDSEKTSSNYYVQYDGHTFYIPNTLQKVRITGQSTIPYYGFTDLKTVKEIILVQENVWVKDYGFSGCAALTRIYLPNGAIYDPNYVFREFDRAPVQPALVTGHEEGGLKDRTQTSEYKDGEWVYTDLFSSITYGVSYDTYMSEHPW